MAKAKVAKSALSGGAKEADGSRRRKPARFRAPILDGSRLDSAAPHLAAICKASKVMSDVMADVDIPITGMDGKQHNLFSWIADNLGEGTISASDAGQIPGDERGVCELMAGHIVALVGEGEKPVRGLYETGSYVPGILPETLMAVEIVSEGGTKKEKEFNAVHPLREALESLLCYIDGIRHAIGSDILEQFMAGKWGKSRED